MTVKEYAIDINLSVAEVLKKCVELGLDAKQANDFLSDEDIIILDNVLNLISTDEEIDLDSAEVIENKVEEIVENINIDGQTSLAKEKLKKQSEPTINKDFLNKRKQMYKHKEKLVRNDKVNENYIVYKRGMTVGDLSAALNVPGSDIIKKLISLGLMVSINQPIDYDNAEIIVAYYNKSLKKEETQDLSNFEEFEFLDDEKDLVKRPPIVTIMGHVDHGKTTLLDTIRNSNIVDKEFGGITQHIGAYKINYNGNDITFIDTPGHAAFTQMRARGASVTDIVIIIVAADDGVMPQTKEAIEHAMSAKVPIIVAINKIDKPGAKIERIMQELAELNVNPEEWGGNVPFVKISAKNNEGIDLLLETILATSEMLELKANPSHYAAGSVIESKIDKNIGGVATVLILNGTLRIGDHVVVGTTYGRIRTMRNDLGEDILEAGPSTPVEITGMQDNPSAGDKFMAFEKESAAKEVASKRKNVEKESKYQKNVVNFDDLFAHINEGNKEINVVLKADVRGSEEAVKMALEKIDNKGVRVKVIRSGIGTISESDIVLANASNAIVIGFNVMPTNITKEIAKEYNVEIRLYTIIYKLVEEIEQAMQGMLDPEYEEKQTGSVEVRKLFKFSKVGTIAGCFVTDGIIKSNALARLIRDGIVVCETKISSLQRATESVKEVKKGFECGITLDNYGDIRVNDIINTYEMVEIKR